MELCTAPSEEREEEAGKLWQISVNVTLLAVATTLHSPPHGRQQWGLQPGLLVQLAGATVGYKDQVLKSPGVCGLISDHCFRSLGGNPEGGHCFKTPQAKEAEEF